MTRPPPRRLPRLILAAFALAATAAFLWAPPVPQPASYHAFADARSWLGVPNFANVVSNLALLAAAAYGLQAVRRRARFRTTAERRLYALFFGAVLFTAFGSAWYHAAPDGTRLVWDRLPLGVAFTTLPALLAAERGRLEASDVPALALWILVGPAAVLWWYVGEAAGYGDLRPYLVLHAFVLVLPPLLLCLPAPYTHAGAYLLAFACYLAAMGGELFDHAIYAATGAIVSGHTLKHLLMGAAVALLARMLAVRHIRDGGR